METVYQSKYRISLAIFPLQWHLLPYYSIWPAKGIVDFGWLCFGIRLLKITEGENQ